MLYNLRYVSLFFKEITFEQSSRERNIKFFVSKKPFHFFSVKNAVVGHYYKNFFASILPKSTFVSTELLVSYAFTFSIHILFFH